MDWPQKTQKTQKIKFISPGFDDRPAALRFAFFVFFRGNTPPGESKRDTASALFDMRRGTAKMH
jgi:hypothetical protein